MKHDKTKAVAVMLLGLAGILCAFYFAIAANSDNLVTPTASPELALEAQRLMVQLCITALAAGCGLLYWGSELLDRAWNREKHRGEVGG